MKSVIFWCCMLSLSLLAAYQVFQTTTWGAGLSSDSINYLHGARSIIEEGNLNRLRTHWPPLYFILIALSSLLFTDTLTALRWLQVTIIFANVLSFSVILWKLTNKTLLLSLIGSLLFATAPSILYNHTMAWSEGLFCLLAMMGIYFLIRYIQNEKNIKNIFISSLLIALAFITRYAGVTLIITGLISLLFLLKSKLKKRLFISFLFGFLCSFPMILWIGRNLLFFNEATNRSFQFHAIPPVRLQQGISVLQNWLHIPSNYPLILLLVAGIITVQYIITLKNDTNKRKNRGFEVSFIFIFTYIVFILFSISFIDAASPLDNRILIPLYIFFYLGILLLIHRSSHIKWLKEFGYIIVLLLFIHALSQYRIQKKFILHAKENGVDFAHKEWVQSETLKWLKTLPADTLIYTNGPGPISIYANRASKMIPRHTSPVSRQRNENIMNDLRSMASEMINGNGVIVYFHTITWRWYLPTFEQLNQLLPLQVVYKGKNATVVRLHQASENRVLRD